MTHEYYQTGRRYRRQPKPAAYVAAGFLFGAGSAGLVCLLTPTAKADPVRMQCISYTPSPEAPELRPWNYARMSLTDPAAPVLVCANLGGVQ